MLCVPCMPCLTVECVCCDYVQVSQQQRLQQLQHRPRKQVLLRQHRWQWHKLGAPVTCLLPPWRAHLTPGRWPWPRGCPLLRSS